MHKRKHEGEALLTVGSGDELMRPATRRQFVRMMGVGGAVVMLPAVFDACAMAPVP
ncbi:MAG: hypothetical protein H0W63_10535, partial [Gemmatimonadaceae bacterium]|nr:hypothetical protein [Gemmatimonadaceae bacterium]